MTWWLPPISFFFLLFIFLVSFCLHFFSFVYSVFGIVCMIFFVYLFCGNKSSSQKKRQRLYLQLYTYLCNVIRVLCICKYVAKKMVYYRYNTFCLQYCLWMLHVVILVFCLKASSNVNIKELISKTLSSKADLRLMLWTLHCSGSMVFLADFHWINNHSHNKNTWSVDHFVRQRILT